MTTCAPLHRLLLALTCMLALASGVKGQGAAFYISAASDSLRIAYVNDADKTMHAVVCCNDRRELVGKDTVTTLRVELARLYNNNFLAGDGVSILLVSKEKRGAPVTKQEWEAKLFTEGEKNLALRNRFATRDEYIRGGVELRYKSPDGQLYSSALGKEKGVYFRISKVEKQQGKAIGGFGTYQYIIEAEFKVRLYSQETTKTLMLQNGKLRIGIWEDVPK